MLQDLGVPVCDQPGERLRYKTRAPSPTHGTRTKAGPGTKGRSLPSVLRLTTHPVAQDRSRSETEQTETRPTGEPNAALENDNLPLPVFLSQLSDCTPSLQVTNESRGECDLMGRY